MVIDWDYNYYILAISLKQEGVKVKTKNGYSVTVLEIAPNDYPIRGYIDIPFSNATDSSNYKMAWWTKDGKCTRGEEYDLVLEIIYVI